MRRGHSDFPFLFLGYHPWVVLIHMTEWVKVPGMQHPHLQESAVWGGAGVQTTQSQGAAPTLNPSIPLPPWRHRPVPVDLRLLPAEEPGEARLTWNLAQSQHAGGAQQTVSE